MGRVPDLLEIQARTSATKKIVEIKNNILLEKYELKPKFILRLK